MMVTATGRATPERVWDRYTRPATWTQWAPHIAAVDCADEVVAAGTTGRVIGPAGVSVDFEIEEVDPLPRSWTWKVGRGSTQIRLHHDVLPTGDGQTMATMRLDGPLATILQPYRLLASRALRGLVADPSAPLERGQEEAVVRLPSPRATDAPHVSSPSPPTTRGSTSGRSGSPCGTARGAC